MKSGRFLRAFFLFAVCFVIVASLIFLLIKWRNGQDIPKIPDAVPQKRETVEISQSPSDEKFSREDSVSPEPKTPTHSPQDLLSDLEPSTPILAMLYGRIFDENGNSLSGVTIRVRSNHSIFTSPNLIASSLTDVEGWYRFEKLPIATVQVLAMKQGFFLETGTVSFSSSRQAIEKNFQLKIGGLSLGGVVLNQEGSPVKEGDLLLWIPGSHLYLEQTTDKTGHFRFDGLWKAHANLSVTAGGYCAWGQSGVPIGDEDMRIILTRGGTRISGEVLEIRTRKPVPGAVVIVQTNEANWRNRADFITKADGKGLFETTALAPGKYQITAVTKFQSGVFDHEKALELVEEGPEEIWVEIFLPDMYDIRGVVLDADTKEPVAGAGVQAAGYSSGDWSMKAHFPGSETVLTDHVGRFRLPNCAACFPRDTISFKVEAKGYVPLHERLENLKAASQAPIILKIREGLRFHGTVLSKQGDPVPEALIQIQNSSSYSRLKFPDATDLSGCFEEFLSSKWLDTDLSFYAFSPDHGFGMETLRIPKDSSEWKQDITLSPGIDLNVYVFDEQEQGVRDCVILAGCWKEKEYSFRKVLYTNPDGSAFFRNLPPREFRITARMDAIGLMKSKELDLGDESAPRELVFFLDEPEKIIFGNVKNEQDQPLEGVRVTLGSRLTHTDQEGKYRLCSIEEYPSGIKFELEGYGKETIRNIKGDKKEVRLDVVLKKQDDYVFYGRIVTMENVAPPEASLEVFRRRGERCRGFSNAGTKSLKNGRFEIRVESNRLKKDASYFIKARHPVYGAGVSPELELDDNTRVGPFDISLSWGTLKGYTRDAKTHEPVEDVLISTREIESHEIQFPNRKNDPALQIRSDQGGYYELSPVPFESSTISFYHPDYWIQKKRSPEISSDNPEVSWDPLLSPKASFEGRVFNPDGAPQPGIQLAIYRGEFYQKQRSDEEGHYRFRGIPPGKYSFAYRLLPFPASNDFSMQSQRISPLLKRWIVIESCEKKTLDLHLPSSVPVLVESKYAREFSLECLDPAEYEKISVFIHRDVWKSPDEVFLPPGKYILRWRRLDAVKKEITIQPGVENWIRFEKRK